MERQWKFTSDELNQKIRELEKDEKLCKWTDNGKPIPYIGWYWRDVYFDSRQYSLGIIPARAERLGQNYIGFMVRNKWGYPSILLTEKQTVKLRELIETVIEYPSKETLAVLINWMQDFEYA